MEQNYYISFKTKQEAQKEKILLSKEIGAECHLVVGNNGTVGVLFSNINEIEIKKLKNYIKGKEYEGIRTAGYGK